MLATWQYFQHANVISPARTNPTGGKRSGVHEFSGHVGVASLLGRGFHISRCAEKKGQVAVISYALFSRKFGKDPSAIAKPSVSTRSVQHRWCSAAGVSPARDVEGFDQKKPDVWLP